MIAPVQAARAIQQQTQELARTDRKVRAHEQAHLAAAGPYATSGASYQYVTGPDGLRYAVGGEVAIDASRVPNDPEATVHKARIIQSAANAPSDPSGQDRAVAAAAQQMEAQAVAELAQQQTIARAYSDDTFVGELLSLLA